MAFFLPYLPPTSASIGFPIVEQYNPPMLARPLHILAVIIASGVSVFLLLRLLSTAGAQPLSGELGNSTYLPPNIPASTSIPLGLDVIIYLEQSANLDELYQINDKATRRREVVVRLQEFAGKTQAPVIEELEHLKRDGLVDHYLPFWIINAIAVTLSPQAVSSLSNLPEIDRIEIDELHEVFGEALDEMNLMPWREYSFTGWASLPDVRPFQAANESIARVRAPEVWNLLGIDGSGVTVAIVDTGVDWEHPALQNNYRGGRGETAQHAGNWYSTVQPTQTVPIDHHGHGTHVAGTAVGNRGIGVAPGAKWIAVAIADEHGRIRDSDVHAAFQWLLAPAGKPDLAPDVVNNSWGTAGDYSGYLEDVRALNAAGIISVFAAGNTGPEEGTINAPASYPGVISVAAEDRTGAITWFSSRGPSPLTDEAKPLLSAPGTQILSAYPAGRYARFNGTSMATPHVTGAIALMLSAEPRLTNLDIAQRLAAAAGNPAPDNSRGWGFLDAYTAVSPLVSTGQLIGRVNSADGLIPGALITITTPSGTDVRIATDSQGAYSTSLLPGIYKITAAAFGYQKSRSSPVESLPGHVVVHDLLLNPIPTGILTIQLVDSGTTQALEGNVLITEKGQPVPAFPTHTDSRYIFNLPAGHYQLEAQVPGFRLEVTLVDIQAGEQAGLNLTMKPGPRLLVVDSGGWQYRSQVTYYRQALSDLGYFPDVWSIDSPYEPLPTLDRLAAYDAVIWTAPEDSPGYLNANDVITDYLGIGGRLLIAGQNVANYDGATGAPAYWWASQLEARWLGDKPPDQTLTGATDTPFEGQVITLNGNDSARNQTAPDQVIPLNLSLTQPVMLYPDGTAAALLAGRCEPFRLLYLGFGLEGVTGRSNRAALMRSSLDVLLGPEELDTALWQPVKVSDFALSGERLTYIADLRNLSRTMTQTFQIEATGGVWPRSILTPTLAIGPCESAETVLVLDVPEQLPRDFSHEMVVTAVINNADLITVEPAALTITHKTPGSVLLVDDDRFVQTEAVYKNGLDRIGITYDVWETGWQNEGRGSPSAEFLQAYDLVIWFTGYDWFQPITPDENEALTAYLEKGGRLFLSSQDFLYRNISSSLPQDYLGVAAFQESITPTMVFADDRLGPSPELAGAMPLDYGAYQNFSDGLVPTAQATPFLWHNQGSIAATAASGTSFVGGHWRSVFWALPFEALPIERHATALELVLGQLSDMGDSQFIVDLRSGSAFDPRVYTLKVINNGAQSRRLWITDTLPLSLTLQNASEGLAYDPGHRQLIWEGVLEPGQSRAFHFTAGITPMGARGRRIDNMVTLASLPLSSSAPLGIFDQIMVTKTATTWIDSPDLSLSQLIAHSAVVPAPQKSGEIKPIQVITYSLVLRNTGVEATRTINATIATPPFLEALEDTLDTTNGTFHLEDRHAIWEGSLLPGETVTASLALTQTAGMHETFPAVAYIFDPVTGPLLRSIFFTPLPNRIYLAFTTGRP